MYKILFSGWLIFMLFLLVCFIYLVFVFFNIVKNSKKEIAKEKEIEQLKKKKLELEIKILEKRIR